MAGEREDLTLGDLGQIVTGKTPLTAVEGNFGGQIPFVTPSDMDGRRTITTTARYLTETGAASVKGSKIPAGSVMVSCIGSDMGKAVVAGRDCVTNQQINSIIVDARFSSEFVYYNLSTRKDEIRHQAAGGSAQPILNKGDFSRLKITLPSFAEQKTIAAVLGALDDKIELNRRMNVTLEAVARALFQSWFVDFDPVHAKLNGRQPPGMDAATAALFPDRFTGVSVGQVPEGWKMSSIGAELKTELGGTPSRAKSEYWTKGTVPWINSGEVNKFRIIEPSELITEVAVKKSATKQLPRRTTVIAITGATLGQVSVTEIECCANQSVVGIVANASFPTEFIYFWVKENIDKLIASQTGGAQQHINKGNVNELALLCPTSKLMEEYTRRATPLFNQIALNCFQARTLATLRDTLLPKLLSGELRVSDVDAISA